jgi:hypothetical protein
VLPAVSGAAGLVFARIKPRLALLAAAVLIIAVAAGPLSEMYRTRSKEDWRSASRTVAEHIHPEDAVIVFRRAKDPFREYYARFAGGPLPPLYDVDDVLDPEIYGEIQEHERIWLLLHDAKRVPEDFEVLMEPLRSRRRSMLEHRFRVDVQLLEGS